MLQKPQYHHGIEVFEEIVSYQLKYLEIICIQHLLSQLCIVTEDGINNKQFVIVKRELSRVKFGSSYCPVATL